MNHLQTPISAYTIPGLKGMDRREWRRHGVGRDEQRVMGEILAKVSEFFDIPVDDIKGVKRFREIVTARKAFCQVCFRELYISCTRVATFINRDHTTVLSAVRVYANERETCPELQTQFDDLLYKIFNNERN